VSTDNPTDHPTWPPPDTAPPPPGGFAPPDEPNPEEERYAIGCAWKTLTESVDRDTALDACPLVATLFASVVSVYEGAEDDPPVMGVLMAIRETVCAWSQAESADTVFADVARVDLALMVRRVDVAMALVKSDAAQARGGAR
jgi:hypothetical protein